MKVVDLFSGLGGWSEAFRDRGHEVFRIDHQKAFGPDLCVDIRDVDTDDFPFSPDVILASPPCEGFSVASIGKMWETPGVPKHPTSKLGLQLLDQTLYLIGKAQPKFWWMENPRGMMRKCVPAQYPRTTVTYCQYGETRMKPTDLWGKWPDTWHPHGMCKNGDPCHEAAPRGAKTGTQGIQGGTGLMTKALRAKVPYALSLEVCLALEAKGV